MSKKIIPFLLQIVILVLALICTIVNSVHYEFPRILLPFLYQLEAVAITFIFLVYFITFLIGIGENYHLIFVVICLFHGILFLAVSTSMLMTFSADTIMGFESDIWGSEKLLFVISGGCGIATSIVLIVTAIYSLFEFGSRRFARTAGSPPKKK